MNRLFLFFILLIVISGIISGAAIKHFYVNPKNQKNMIPQIKPLTKLPTAAAGGGSVKCCVYMIATPDIQEYSKHTIDNNRRYCKQHNIDFVVFSESLDPTLPINFTKIIAGLQLMTSDPSVKYVIHIDADAIIKDHSYDIRNIIRAYFKGLTAFIAAEDCYDLKTCSKPNKMNSGVFIVKNNTLGKTIMNQWLQGARGKCKGYVNQFPNCQLVFEHCVRNKYWMYIKLVPYNALNGVDGLFIQHHMQGQLRDRIDHAKYSIMNNDPGYTLGTRRLTVY